MMRTFAVLGCFFVLATASAAVAKIGGGDVTFRMKGAGNVVFRHDTHAGRQNLKCSECHYRLYSTVAQHNAMTMADMRNGKSCGACHDGVRAFNVEANCTRCHQP